MNVANKGNHLFRPSEWYSNFKMVSTLIWVNLFHLKNTSTIMATRKVLVIICHNLFILKSSAPSVLKVKNSSQKILSSEIFVYKLFLKDVWTKISVPKRYCPLRFLFIHLSEIAYSKTCTVTLTVLDVPKGPSTTNLWKQVLTWTKCIFKIQNCQKYECKPLQIIIKYSLLYYNNYYQNNWLLAIKAYLGQSVISFIPMFWSNSLCNLS